VNPNYNELSLHSSCNGYHQKDKRTSVVEDAKKGNPYALLVGMCVFRAIMGNTVKVSPKVKNRTTI
jgi:UDP-N-acetyl-D-mannosaminuronic acid transferase (WecB/TagA/CpsF family)